MAGRALAQTLPAVVHPPTPLTARSDRQRCDGGADQTPALPGIAPRNKKARFSIGLLQSKRGCGRPLDPLESGAFVTVVGSQNAKRGVSHADNQQRVESHT
jgi:hypothetical protein